MICCGYCKKQEDDWAGLLHYKCEECEICVHYDCINSKQPSTLFGDVLFIFKCKDCGEDKKEEFDRQKLSWRQVVMLALYNLHKTEKGNRGFFHWKGHICAFIKTHWLLLFGLHKKQTSLWQGTIAGTLSSGCPDVFESGVRLVDQGYWRLIDVEPPSIYPDRKAYKPRRRAPVVDTPVEFFPDRSRRQNKTNLIDSAMELKKQKRDTVVKPKPRTKKSSKATPKQDEVDTITVKEEINEILQNEQASTTTTTTTTIPVCNDEESGADIGCSSTSNIIMESEMMFVDNDMGLLTNEVEISTTSTSPLHNATLMDDGVPLVEDNSTKSIISKSMGLTLNNESDSDDDLDIDVDIESFVDLRPTSPEMGTLIPSEDIKWEKGSIPEEEEENWEDFLSSSSDSESDGESEKNMKANTKTNQNEESEMEEEDEEEDKNDNANSDNNGNCDNDNEEEQPAEESDDTDSADSEEGDEEEDDGDNSSNRMTPSSMGDQVEERRVLNEHGQMVPVKKKKKKVGRPRKRRRIDDPQPVASPDRLQRISVFEETELLNTLNVSAAHNTLTPELAVLRRKLICNKTNREYGQAVFDLDAQVEKSLKSQGRENPVAMTSLPPRFLTKAAMAKETRDLDRFMMKDYGKKKEGRTYTSFIQRLVGLEDHQLKPIVSPYTTRVLVPFIWRNKNMKRQPLKMRLLQEIQAYPHRHNLSWAPQPAPSIDYCYVRPEHIASVNALSREFFWPGIDMSECLQYPDFSCVVLYRKIVIAFAFMVPDRGYNEAYISFIFTHPEWRGVGIASFMLYHLIQTCMGKDVLLHVSASNPAMLLYQKFGFKAEELSLNFYHKYFPANCPDSCHAFLMRLSR